MTMFKTLNTKYLGNDLSAGIVVFLVALPLCLGIALASGAPFFSGIISGIIGGIVIGMLSNSHVSVSGPAAGLVTIVLGAIATLGSFEAFLAAVVISGIIQILMGVIKIGSIAEYFPTSVVRGMLTAIGMIIIIKQIPHGLGYDKDVMFLSEDHSFDSIGDIFLSILQVHPGATLVCALSLTIILLWERPIVKKYVSFVPGGLVAVVAAGLISELVLSGMGEWHIASEHRVNVPIASDFQEFWALIRTPDFSQFARSDVYVIAMTLAIVASIETLLCIEAADKLDPERRITSTNRELMAQGTGNILSGLVGGLPITSVIVRTSANVQANAKTKLSTIVHGVLLLAAVLAVPYLLNTVPLSCLAAILFVVGYKLCNPAIFKTIFEKGWDQFIPFVTTVIAILLFDLLTGVACGLVVSLFFVLNKNLKNSYYFHSDDYKEGNIIQLHLAQEVSFLNRAAIRRTLDHVPENATVEIDASQTFYIDSDVLDVIREFQEIKAPQRGIKCVMKGFKEHYGINNNHFVEVVEKA